MIQTHLLKTWPEYFEAVARLDKTFEVRKNDRDFKVGDLLVLQEYDNEHDWITGRYVAVTVTYVLQGGQFGVDPGYVVLGLSRERIYQPYFNETTA